VHTGTTISVTNFPGVDGARLGFTITVRGLSVSLTLTGDNPTGPVLFELPSFVGNLRPSGAGAADARTGTVTLPPGARHLTVELAHQP
jgi:hypothetical protein